MPRSTVPPSAPAPASPRAADARQAGAVARARAILDAAQGRAVPLAELAAAAGMSPHHLQRVFTRHVGASPRAYAAALRAERLRAALRDEPTVSRAVFAAGYGASSRAYEAAEAQLGMTPAAYRRGGAGVRLRYTIATTSLGAVLVAATARGVSAVTLGADPAALEAALAAEYPRAERERVDLAGLPPEDDLARWAAAVVRQVEGTRAGSTGESALRTAAGEDGAVPLDVAGTPFQQRVWRAVRAIPAGETTSYSALAAAVGAPRAVRAVASAVARNRVALLVPCHRVVRADGATGEYRWGAERKRALLAREQDAARGATR